MVDRARGEEVAYDGRATSDATSFPSAASRAASRASAGAASRKWKVVPPSISIEGRGRWVSTKAGVWNEGFGPHVHGAPPGLR
jgi:hypothetical protein